MQIRVRLPTTEQKEDENLQKIIDFHLKLHPKRNHRRNNEDDDDEEADDGDDSDESIDFDIAEIADEEHQCFGQSLIQRQDCNTKPCKLDRYGRPRE